MAAAVSLPSNVIDLPKNTPRQSRFQTLPEIYSAENIGYLQLDTNAPAMFPIIFIPNLFAEVTPLR